MDRFLQLVSGADSAAGRGSQWADTLRVVRDFPILGSGLGTYAFNYPFYKTLRTQAVFDHAHNDYLELLSEGGVVGLGLCAWGIIRFATTTANVRAVFSYGGNPERRRKEISRQPRKPLRHKAKERFCFLQRVGIPRREKPMMTLDVEKVPLDGVGVLFEVLRTVHTLLVWHAS